MADYGILKCYFYKNVVSQIFVDLQFLLVVKEIITVSFKISWTAHDVDYYLYETLHDDLCTGFFTFSVSEMWRDPLYHWKNISETCNITTLFTCNLVLNISKDLRSILLLHTVIFFYMNYITGCNFVLQLNLDKTKKFLNS